MSRPHSGPTTSHAPNNTTTTTTSRLSSTQSQKPRQLSHLHAQLAQLTAHVSDLENLLRMTAVQAESMRGLGGYAGGMCVRLFPFPTPVLRFFPVLPKAWQVEAGLIRIARRRWWWWWYGGPLWGCGRDAAP